MGIEKEIETQDTQRYHSLLWKLVDGSRKRKIRKFYDLLANGKEFHYDFLQDKLYADLNLTLTDKHLAMKMLECLDPEIARKAREIMGNEERSKRSRVLSIARLVKGKTILELQEASEKAAGDVNVPDYMIEDLKTLKPTRLVIWTDTPRQTVDVYKELKLNPVYNSSGEPLFIAAYATELAHENGILTGEVTYIPDEFERHNIQTLEQLAFLKKNIELIV